MNKPRERVPGSGGSVSPESAWGALSINIMFVIGGPQLGQVESSVVAAVWSPEASVVSGGLACLIVVGATALLAPEVPAYRDGSKDRDAVGAP